MIKYNSEDLKSHNGVAAVIKNKEGKILMLDHIKFNVWTIPMGKVKEDETIIEGLEVEMFEEINIEVISSRELISGKKEYNRSGKIITVVCHVFEIENYNGEIINKEIKKHRSAKWMSLDEVLSLEKVSDATELYIEYIKNNIKK